MSRPLRIGWIGCGTHADQMLLPQLVRYPVAIAALCDCNASRLAAMARRYGVQATYGDHRDLVRHAGLDAVFMAVGPAAHHAIGLDVLARGLPLFVEKPPGADLAQARALRDAAVRAGVPVGVGFMKRFATGNRIARNVVGDPDFGPVLGLLASYMTAPGYFAGDAGYDGFFLHHCVHYADLVRHLAGSACEVRARSVENGPGHLLLHVDLAMRGGAIGTLVMGTIQARSTPMEFVQIMGDHRRVEVRNVTEVTYYREPTFKTLDAAPGLSGAHDTLCWQPNLTAAANDDHKGYHPMLGAMLDLVHGLPSAMPTIEDGVRAMALLDAMIRSHASGAATEVEDG